MNILYLFQFKATGISFKIIFSKLDHTQNLYATLKLESI